MSPSTPISTPTPTPLPISSSFSRIPQPTRLFHYSPSPSLSTSTGTNTRKPYLSPKLPWSHSPKRDSSSIPKYPLQDPGVVSLAGTPKAVKRTTFRPVAPARKRVDSCKTGLGVVRDGGASTVVSSSTSTKRTAPTASLWSRPAAPPPTPTIPGPSRNTCVKYPASPSPQISTTSRIPPPHLRLSPTKHTRSHSSIRAADIPPNPAYLKSRLPLPEQHPSPTISICATVATAPSTPLISIPSIPFPISAPIPSLAKSRLPIPINSTPSQSPTISICATVGPASPPLPSSMSRNINISQQSNSNSETDSEHESIYSSASALALARYRSSLPSPQNQLQGQEQGQEMSRISSTTSFSSASSLARHRLSRTQLSERGVGNSIPMSTMTSTTEEEEMALIWEPDPESSESDPAANLWMEIEARLNRRSNTSLNVHGQGQGQGQEERGQWVLTARQRQRQRQRCRDRGGEPVVEHDDMGEKEEEDEERRLGSEGMKKESSEFTISAYFDPDLSTPIAPSRQKFRSSVFTSTSTSSGSDREMNAMAMGMNMGIGVEGTAIFNMSAPLIHSTSQDNQCGTCISATPANTPIIHHETIQRVSRVRKSFRSRSQSRSSSSMTCTISSRVDSSNINAMVAIMDRPGSEPRPNLVSLSVPGSLPMLQDEPYSAGKESTYYGNNEGPSTTMTRLDSHVQAALEVLSDIPDLPSRPSNTAHSRHLNNHDESSEVVSNEELNEATPIPVTFWNGHDATPTLHCNGPYSTSDVTGDDDGDRDRDREVGEVGLGIGINLYHKSIYSLPILSPRFTRRTTGNSTTSSSIATSTSREEDRSSDSRSTGASSTSSTPHSESQDDYGHKYESEGRQEQKNGWSEAASLATSLRTIKGNPERECGDENVKIEEDLEEEEGMLTVTDLDTGHRIDLSIKQLDELWRL